jgi:hypothetical protein
VVFGAEYLLIFQEVCICEIFEPYAKFDVVHLYLAWVECLLTDRTYWSVPKKDFFSDVHSSLPACVPDPDSVVGEEAFSFDPVLFSFDFFFLGKGLCQAFIRRFFALYSSGRTSFLLLVPKLLSALKRCITFGMLKSYFLPSQCAICQYNALLSFWNTNDGRVVHR